MKSIIAVGLLFVVGCGARRESPESSIQAKDSTYFVTILLDMSGSFEPLMAENGKAYQFSLRVIDRYFRDRMGEAEDQMVIAQISGSDRTLLWQGTPLQLRKEFPTASAFREMLRLKASTITRGLPQENGNQTPVIVAGSNIHESIVKTMEYVTSEPGVMDGRVRSAVFVLSDMLDNAPETEKTKKEALEALTRFGQAGHTIGLYYVDQLIVGEWRTSFAASGIKHWYVGSGIESQPILPSFE